MNAKYEALPDATDRIVYVRPVKVADLPKNIRAQAEGAEEIFSVHNADGERLALVGNRGLAFTLAREHDYAPMSVH